VDVHFFFAEEDQTVSDWTVILWPDLPPKFATRIMWISRVFDPPRKSATPDT
jgi:hypothetical protein